MKIYSIKHVQVLPTSLDDAWNFFSSPRNLSLITPGKLNIRIQHISGSEKMYAGQLIRYKISVLPGITVNWLTEITHAQEPHYFVDEQRFGPYALWHHQHSFLAVPNGVEITDEVHYAIPLGILGRFVHWLFVKRRLNAIFDYRREVLSRHFS
ncbi:SRPBCC family protein [Dawidia soli]|uniref:SRPBCC family protein n=1 Tax=Dawidia soli TaxID=2782352 RepID=A0AAP2GGI4_9BACT|nr:SRPBCC family protein [Dawidia soli]MBT1685043.1 SRPBCC family protein [Dawidia soli]